MHCKSVGAVALGVFVLSAATTAVSQQNVPSSQSIDLGKWEFEAHCAVCHGLSGAADAPYEVFLTKSTPNLSTLSKRNGGVFPFARVYEVIDGRQEVQAHGPKDMPIWGRDYMAMGTRINPYYDPEAFVRAKILALTEYVYRLQAK